MSSAKAKSHLFSPLLAIIVLVEGFICVSIEILTLRQLLPVVGGSVIVTSIIIGLFLLFLALGYRKGGSVLKDFSKKLRKNFWFSALLLGIGLSYLFVILFFEFSQKIFGTHFFMPLLLYLLLIISPLIYLLGQTIPIAMNELKAQNNVGKMVGDFLGVSTLGSFLGATATTLLFMQYLGVAWTIYIDVGLLLLLILLLTPKSEIKFGMIISGIFILGFIYWVNIFGERTFFLKTNQYANYELIHHPKFNLKQDEKVLIINHAWSSYTNAKKEGFPYIERIKQLLFHDMELRGSKILVLGAGGFSLTAQGNFNNEVTYVDIDTTLINITKTHFNGEMEDKVVIDDARHFLQSSSDHYQAIVIDTFTDTKAIPAHLLSYEFMIAIQKKLSPEGTAIFNMIINPFLKDPYSKRIDNTIRSVFKNCISIPEHFKNQPTNLIYACNQLASQTDLHIYSDNFNTSTLDGA